jgi:hypothetical protein
MGKTEQEQSDAMKRHIRETFEYCNTMKNGSISEKIQEQELHAGEKKTSLS